MELHSFGRVNMDLQYNQGSEVKRYMCKYLTKQAVIQKATIAQDRNQYVDNRHVVSDAYIQNFHYRSVSVTEAIMELCDWVMPGVSHSVVYLATDHPDKRQSLLKRARDIRKTRAGAQISTFPINGENIWRDQRVNGKIASRHLRVFRVS